MSQSREEWEAVRQRMLKRVDGIIADLEQDIRDLEYWHTLPVATETIDFEPERVLLSLAKRYREHLIAGTRIPAELSRDFMKAAGAE